MSRYGKDLKPQQATNNIKYKKTIASSSVVAQRANKKIQ